MLIPYLRGIKVYLRSALKGVLRRFGYNNDGIDDYAVLPYRAINPDGNIDIEFWSPEKLDVVYQIVSQNITSNSASVEFSLESNALGSLIMRVGGAGVTVFTLAQGYLPSTKYRIFYDGTRVYLYSANGTLLRDVGLVRGTVREPTALTVIGAFTNNAINTYSRFFKGVQRDVKINGVLYPIQDRNQTIQLPQPSGLGDELITPTVLENPAVNGSQWTYLGDGRWQYVGDGTFNVLEPLSTSARPTAGYLEFEVESISGQMTCTRGNLTRSRFNTTGVFRYFYTDVNESGNNNAAVRFTRATNGQVVSCIIKNISFKPLAVASAELLTNSQLANNAQGWTIDNVAVTQSGNNVRLTNTQASYAGATMQTFNTVAGKDYLITANFPAGTTSRLSINAGNLGAYTGSLLAVNYPASAGLVSAVFRATSNQATIRVLCNSSNINDFIEINGLQIKPVDSVCNPMTLVNVTSDRWQEVPQ